MSKITVFETTLQKTHHWLQELARDLDWKDEHRAYLALRAVLQALRDRLPVEEAAQLGAQLPMLVRGIYYEGWRPANKPEKLSAQEFLELVSRGFPNELIDAAAVTTAVFGLLNRQISEGELADLRGLLPTELRRFWPPPDPSARQAA